MLLVKFQKLLMMRLDLCDIEILILIVLKLYKIIVKMNKLFLLHERFFWKDFDLNISNNKINSSWQESRSCITSTSKEMLDTKRREQMSEWFDAACTLAIAGKNKVRKK